MRPFLPARSLLCLASCLLFSFSAEAGVAAADAARLGKELTAIGAERAGNKDGTIPAWTGASNFTDEQKHYTPADLEKLRKGDPDKIEKTLEQAAGSASKVSFEITAANLAQYAGKLSDGHKALFAAYPDYKMRVYPTIRTGYFPPEIEAATIANATAASLEGSDSVKGAKLGFPFPIPKSGAEVIWNHKLKFKGDAARRYNNQAIVKPDGSYLITKLVEDVKFVYANIEHPGDGKLSAFYQSETLAPARVAGQITLVHETADQSSGGRAAWIFSPALGRVTRAPDVGYDNPAVGTDGEQFNDQIDVFNGALDRYSWKLIGKKEIYIPYNSYLINSPKVKYKDILRAHHINQDLARYELHRVWVVEATLKPGQRHQFAKRVFYVDEDSWSIAVVDCYDERGKLWKVQEAHLLTAPFVPTVTGVPELIYDLQSKRYFTTAMSNEEQITDFQARYDDNYFDPATLKRRARNR
ncbi:DUF1329 domain-containing protein [Hydrocarboniphaga sp.]|uniref:DUF1329 domain-containing protein n=1 Tax=Hydrocarboniphaga sp. TaxID=2033016 RepID=UPI003D0B4804